MLLTATYTGHILKFGIASFSHVHYCFYSHLFPVFVKELDVFLITVLEARYETRLYEVYGSWRSIVVDRGPKKYLMIKINISNKFLLPYYCLPTCNVATLSVVFSTKVRNHVYFEISSNLFTSPRLLLLVLVLKTKDFLESSSSLRYHVHQWCG
jgi:hypothetical protein